MPSFLPLLLVTELAEAVVPFFFRKILKASFEYREPRQRARMYSTCLVGTTFTLRGTVSALPPVTLVSPEGI